MLNYIHLNDFVRLCRLLQNNEITGSIPDVIGKLEKLQTLDLSNNKLTGEIPTSLGDLYNLNYLWVCDFYQSKFAITHSVYWLKSCYFFLQDRRLNNNSLSGNIPDSLSKVESLTLVYVTVIFSSLVF